MIKELLMAWVALSYLHNFIVLLIVAEDRDIKNKGVIEFLWLFVFSPMSMFIILPIVCYIYIKYYFVEGG